MELLKKSLLALILLLVVIIAWIFTTIYWGNTRVDVDPNANSYTRQIKNSFDSEELKKITDRTKQNFPVAPKEFLDLNQSK